MLTYQEALGKVLAASQAVADVETIPLLYSTGRVLAEDVGSSIAVPRWDNAQMDGFAVRAEDLVGATNEKPVTLKVSQRIPAGKWGSVLEKGTVARIFTGAPMPEGADTVVPQERVAFDENEATFKEAPRPDAWVRHKGSDIEQGSIVLHQGQRLTPGLIGIAASIGRAYVTVYRKIRVGIFFSGDELVQPGEPLPPGGIYNSNRYVLRSFLSTLGCEVLDLGNVPDNFEETKAAFARAAQTVDVVLSTGGMSVGEEDHIKPAVQALGHLDVWRVCLKPGKPLAFGQIQGKPFIGIPGNPVAGFVVFLTIVRPFLIRCMGVTETTMQAQSIRADFDWLKPGDREEFLRVRRNEAGGLDLYPNQNSQVLSSCAWADGLVDLPAGQNVKKGDRVDYYPFCQFFV